VNESRAKKSGRRVLSKDELLDLSDLLRLASSQIAQLRRDNPLAQHIQFPKIPSILSESLVVHLLESGDILPDLAGFRFTFGSKRADVIAEKNGDARTIEVKATGKSAFQNFVAKDAQANYIIWIHFGGYFTGSANPALRAFVLRKPSRYFSGRTYVNLKDLPRRVPDLIEMPIPSTLLERGAGRVD
jgi:hypothetical protein